MISQIISYFRYLSTILIAVLMVFTMPTPSLESQVGSETARTAFAQGMESNVKWLVRKQGSASEGIRLAMLLSASLLLFLSWKAASLRILPATRIAFCPLIARRLTRLRLSPIKFTSLYV
ncbi:hypothetical protein [Paenibacillus sp. MBLB4367]|uniref:hypothetical protein n=1 Tax=Paenibacillus sp. MBLB4367 TaxID=3384767 RepID=UPI0039080CCE